MDREERFESVLALETEMRDLFERYMKVHAAWTASMSDIESDPETRAQWIEWVECQ